MAEAFAGTRSRYFPSLMNGRRSVVRDAGCTPKVFVPSPLVIGFPRMSNSTNGPNDMPDGTDPMLLFSRSSILSSVSPSIAPISTVWIKLSLRKLRGVPHDVAILEALRHTDTRGMRGFQGKQQITSEGACRRVGVGENAWRHAEAYRGTETLVGAGAEV